MDVGKYLKDNFFLFKGISSEVIEELLNFEGLSETKVSQGEIIQSCSLCDKIGIITKGKAIIRSDVDGVIINKLYKNDIYGAAALFDKPT